MQMHFFSQKKILLYLYSKSNYSSELPNKASSPLRVSLTVSSTSRNANLFYVANNHRYTIFSV